MKEDEKDASPLRDLKWPLVVSVLMAIFAVACFLFFRSFSIQHGFRAAVRFGETEEYERITAERKHQGTVIKVWDASVLEQITVTPETNQWHDFQHYDLPASEQQPVYFPAAPDGEFENGSAELGDIRIELLAITI